jgi:hypothetical protein
MTTHLSSRAFNVRLAVSALPPPSALPPALRLQPAPCRHRCDFSVRLAAAKRPPPRLQRAPCSSQAPTAPTSTCALPPALRLQPAPCRHRSAFNLRLAATAAPSTCALPVAASPSDLCKLKLKYTQRARPPPPRRSCTPPCASA